MKKQNVYLGTALILMLILTAFAPGLLTTAQPNGPWPDEIAFFEESDENKAVDMLATGAADIYLWGTSTAAVFQKIRTSPAIKYGVAYGMFNELSINPAEFKTGWNPFTNPRMREAINYIIDRNYIANDIFAGLAIPKWVSIISAFPDYGKLADVIKPMEFQYRYDFEKGKQIIYEEMAKMGATLVDGKWNYKGSPVVLKVLIRTEDQRKDIGIYTANQLDKLGFTTDRMLRRRTEASPIWNTGDPTLGQWNIYTGGWIAGIISLDDSSDPGFFYTPLGGGAGAGGFLSWAKPDPIFYEIATKLWRSEYKDDAERIALMGKALPYELKDSTRVWVVDQISAFPARSNVEVAVDFGAGTNNRIWTRTIKLGGAAGGTVKAASMGVFVDPWNPVAGTNWLYDAYIQHGIDDTALLISPYTGKYMMNRVVNYTVTVDDKGMKVPTDVITYKWDFATNSPVFAKDLVATTKVTATYDTNWGKYHDGTSVTLADFFGIPALAHERANPASPLYDEASLPGYQSTKAWYAGWRIVSTNPLKYEWYGNQSNPVEPSWTAASYIGWPNMPWTVLAIARLAEQNGELAFSSPKSARTKLDWMNLIGGPSLPILAKWLDWAITNKYIPEDLKNLAAKYNVQITPDEAVAKYQALKKFYQTYGHFWVASGPFFLYKADFTAHQAVERAFRDYPYKADRWAFLSTPPVPELGIKVPTQVVPGLETKINVTVSYKGQPYAKEKVQFVKYLVTDPFGNNVGKGEAAFGSPGTYVVTLSAQTTGSFTPGAYSILAIATSTDVAVPATMTSPFTVIPALVYFTTMTNALQAQLLGRIQTIESSTTTLQASIDSLKSSLNMAYAVAGLALVVALAAVFLSLRKPKA